MMGQHEVYHAMEEGKWYTVKELSKNIKIMAKKQVAKTLNRLWHNQEILRRSGRNETRHLIYEYMKPKYLNSKSL